MPKKRPKILETRFFGFIIALFFALVVTGLNYGTVLLSGLEQKTLDTHFYLKNQGLTKTVQEGSVVSTSNLKISDDILIVGVDGDSLAKFGRWPFPRYRHADLMNAFSRIKDQTQRENSLLLDVFLNDDADSPAVDETLKKAIGDSGRIFLETLLDHAAPTDNDADRDKAARENLLYAKFGTLTKVKGPWESMPLYLTVDPPLAKFAESASGYGHANFSPELDQVFRHQPLVLRSSEMLEEIPVQKLVPGYTVDGAKFERLAWMDKDSRYHNIKTPLTAASIESLAKVLEKDSPAAQGDLNGDGQNETYFLVRKYRDTFVPSITLSLALRYFGKTLDDVDVIIGDRIHIPAPTRYNPETGERDPYQIQVTPDTFDDKTGELVKAGTTRNVPFIDIPIDNTGSLLINFMGPPSSANPEGGQTFPVRSYASYASKAPASTDPATWRRTLAVENKIIMVGAFDKGMAADEKPTPFGLMYGIEIHANALNTILMDNFIKTAPVWIDLLVLAALLLVVAFMSSRLSTVLSFFGTLVIVGLYFLGVTTAFDSYSYLLPFVSPAIAVILTFIAIVVYRATTEERDKRRIQATFGKYVSPEVVEQLADNPPELGGVDRELTVFFSDIRGFTSISENMTPQELINHLNEYLGAMTDILLEYDGTLDKYMGDAVMGFWGAPLPQPDHALRACKCALRQMEKLKELNAGWPEQKRLNIGIGLNSGIMTVGNMGSSLRMNYTLAGDNVNLGSRLEGTNKAYGTNIIISEYTYGLVRDKVVVRELDNIRVKGKNKPVLIYELVDVLEGLDPPSKPKKR